MTSLVIVESPAKARTIAGYLGGDFVVESSIGHIRDLPNRASDVPKEQRERYGKLGVDVEHEFDPYYATPTCSCSRRTKTAKARRSRGTYARC
jgi:DNA topoisomerase-1